MPVVLTTVPAEILTRAPTGKGKTPFQPITSTVFRRDTVPASLSSISVLNKPPPSTTDYITPRVGIDGRDFDNDICIGYPYKILTTKCSGHDFYYHTYFMGTGKPFFLIVTSFKIN